MAPPAAPTPVATSKPVRRHASPLTYELSAVGSQAATGHKIVAFTWSLDGKVIGHAETLTHTFFKGGVSYTVTLTVTDDLGQSTTTSITVKPVLHIEQLSVNLNVRFAQGSATLTAADKRTLAGVRPLIRAAGTASITGFCASNSVTNKSGDEFDLKLSRRRAHAVVEFLFAGHVPHSMKMTVTGVGATHFAASNATAAGRITSTVLIPTTTAAAVNDAATTAAWSGSECDVGAGAHYVVLVAIPRRGGSGCGAGCVPAASQPISGARVGVLISSIASIASG